ncbi:MAG: BF3164 family lipoprotein [Bacteroidales bacterium]|nr:BF3164 family lipoprotein [Bacteroidales bacterium]
MRKILLLFLIIWLSSCSKKSDYSYVDLSNARILPNPQRLLRFSDKYPFDIAIKDSLAVMLFSKEDTCGAVYNLNTQKPVGYFGVVGNGPGEITRLNFITNKNYALIKNALYFTDTNRRQLLSISLGTEKNQFVLNNLMDYPGSIFASTNLNIVDDWIIGRKIGMQEQQMFYIYDRNTQNLRWIEYPSFMPSVRDKNYDYASRLAFNASKEKIIAGMYFADMVHLYNIQGERKKTICFSEKWLPEIQKERLITFDGCSGILGLYPTEKYCYLLRVEEKNLKANKIHLIKIDWNGNLVASYVLANNFESGFCVDEELNRVYLIQNTLAENDVEYYDVVYYDLN